MRRTTVRRRGLRRLLLRLRRLVRGKAIEETQHTLMGYTSSVGGEEALHHDTVSPVGGVKEKVLGAHGVGATNKVILPWANRKDVEVEHDVQKEVRVAHAN